MGWWEFYIYLFFFKFRFLVEVLMSSKKVRRWWGGGGREFGLFMICIISFWRFGLIRFVEFFFYLRVCEKFRGDSKVVGVEILFY